MGWKLNSDKVISRAKDFMSDICGIISPHVSKFAPAVTQVNGSNHRVLFHEAALLRAAHTCNLALGRWKPQVQEFKIILGYEARLGYKRSCHRQHQQETAGECLCGNREQSSGIS